MADPCQELAITLFEFGCGDLDPVCVLYDGYVSAGGPGRIERPRQFTMLIAQLGHLGELACRRWLDPTRGAERQRLEGRVDEFVEDPLPRTFIESVLDAVAGR